MSGMFSFFYGRYFNKASRVFTALLLTVACTACEDGPTGTGTVIENPSDDAGGISQTPDQNVPESATPPDTGTLNASAFLLTSGESILYKINAISGRAEVLHDFEEYPEFTGPADVINDTVFITADDNSLNAFNLTTGAFLWDTPLGSYKNDSYPTAAVCDDATCFAAGETGVLLAINAADGSVKWSSRFLPDDRSDVTNLFSNLLVAGNNIYINVGQRVLLSEDYTVAPHLKIYDRQTGQEKTRFESPAYVDIASNILVLGGLGGGISAADVDTLEYLWTLQDPTLDFGRPVIVNNVIVLPVYNDTNQQIVGLDLASGNRLWTVDAGSDNYVFTPTTDGRLVYTARGSDRVCSFYCPGADGSMAIDPTNGSIVWQRQWANMVENPLVAKGTAFYGWYRDYINGGPTNGPANNGVASVNAATGDINWFAQGVSNRGADWFVETPVLVQDGQTYRSSKYPDARP